MVKRETVQIGGQTLDLIISGPGDRDGVEAEDLTKAPEAQGTEVTFSPGEIYGPLAHKAKERQAEAEFLAGLDPNDRISFVAFKDDGSDDETWLCGHMTAEGWLAYVAFKKYGEGGTLTHTAKAIDGVLFGTGWAIGPAKGAK
jgi:hypothetical protein